MRSSSCTRKRCRSDALSHKVAQVQGVSNPGVA